MTPAGAPDDARRLAYLLSIAAGTVPSGRAPVHMSETQLLEARVWAGQRLLEARAAVGRGDTPLAPPDALAAALAALDVEWMARGETLRQAKARVEAALRDGIDCPCCGRLARLYRRNFSALMAATCIWLVRTSEAARDAAGRPPPAPLTDPAAWAAGGPSLHALGYAHAAGQGWVEFATAVKSNPTIYRYREHSRLVQFGLAEEAPSPFAGWYRPTAAGIAFAVGSSGVSAAIETYNEVVLAHDPKLVMVTDILEGFDVQRLLAASLTDAAAWEVRRARGTPPG